MFLIFFSSCEEEVECKFCQIEYNAINGFDTAVLNIIAKGSGFTDFSDMLDAEYPPMEFCGDELSDIEGFSEYEDLDGDGINDVYTWISCN